MLYSFGYKDEKGRYKPFKYYCGQSVNPKDWDLKKMIAIGPYSSSVNSELKKIEFETNKVHSKHFDEKLDPTFFKGELDKALNHTELIEDAKTDPLQRIIKYVDKYLADIESGKRRTFRDVTRKFSSGTITNIRSFKKKIVEYENHTGQKVMFIDVDMKFYQNFVVWLQSMHAINTVGKFIRQLKTIMQAAFDDDVHTNLNFKKKGFKAINELVDTIYLNDKDIDLLFDYETTGGHEKAKDLFLVGCFTLQRVSDFTRISRTHISKTQNGTPVIRITQTKTGNLVVIPFIDQRLVRIMEKYDYILPTLSEQKINKYIKEVSFAAGIVDKAKDVTTHTARRSGCTNMYNANIPIGKIMKISGHKTEQEFRKYIRVTDEENAEELSDHPFFTRIK